MSYNIICESCEKLNWAEINKGIPYILKVELLPMPGLGIGEGDALGISVPFKNVGKKAWRELEKVLLFLLDYPQLDIYELYSNKRITKDNLAEIRAQVI